MTLSDSDSSAEDVKPSKINDNKLEIHQRYSKFRVTAVDTERPSTSREGNSTMIMTSGHGNEIHKVTKRKLDINGKCHERAKRLRSTEAEPPQVGRNSDVIMDTDSTESCLGEDRPPEQDTEILSDDERTYETNATVRDTLHGNVYQWKHMLLLLLRARKKGCKFSFATEMKPAGKFDDAVLEYEVPGGGKVHRFLQFKHVKGDKKVTVEDLLKLVKEDPFGMIKYCISHREISNNPIFNTSKSKDLILCTNRGLDVEGLEAKGIKVTMIEIDDFLKLTEIERDDSSKVTKEPKKTPCFYKFVDEPSILHAKLKLKLAAPRKGMSQKDKKKMNLESGAGASDEEISNFFKYFILAVDQPNEIDLGEMIKHELGDDNQFNLLDVDLIMDFFLNIMVNLLKQPEKNRKFLTEQHFDDIFKELRGKLNCLITIGLKSLYLEELKKYDIKFEVENSDLRKFLTDSTDLSRNTPLILTSSNPTLLTALKAYETVEQLRRYKKMDSSIFIRLEELLSPNITDVVLGAFGSSICNVLLVIDCRSISDNGDTQTLWSRLRDILGKIPGKKLILIIQENDSSAVREIRGERVDDIVIDDSIIDLAEGSQHMLLEKCVIKFQGHDERTSFKKIFAINGFDIIASDKLSALDRIIQKETLIQLIRGEEIVIGREIQGLGDVKKYYIPRTIVERVVIKAEILVDPKIPDLFVIGGIDQNALEKIVKTENRNQTLEKRSLKKLDLDKYHILPSGREADHYRNMCDQNNSNRNIHWLQGETGALVWQQSSGSITNLLAFRNTSMDHDNREGPGATGLTEDELAKHDQKRRIVILSDVAGMGKSTLLTHLARKMKRDQSSLLVIKVDLNQYTRVLKAEKDERTFEKDDTNGAVNFLVDKLSKLNTDFEPHIFKELVKVTGETVVLIDGYDEICPDYGDVVIDLLRSLAKLPIKRLFITTRPHTSIDLEREFGMFSHVLQPFDQENKMEFLTKFWGAELNLNDSDGTIKVNLQKHASAVLDILSKVINSQMQEFTGIPSQLRLVADYLPFGDEEKLKRFESSEKPMYITNLYGSFIKKKFEIFFTQKLSGDPTNPGQKRNRKDMYRSFRTKHQKLALEALFDEETVTALMKYQQKTDETSSSSQDEEDEDEGDERSGLVTQVINGEPHFVHRTFAEYLAAAFLSEKLKHNGCDPQVQKFFVAELLVKSVYRTIRAFLNCLLCRRDHAPDKYSWTVDLKQNCDEFGQTLYHKAAMEHNTEIVRFFSIRLNKIPYNVPESCNITGSEISIAAKSPKQDLDINLEDEEQRTPLMIAVSECVLDLVKCFVEAGADINRGSEDGFPALYLALDDGGQLEIFKYLFENGAEIDRESKDDVWAMLCYALENGAELDVVQYLVEKGADIKREMKDCSTALHCALQGGVRFEVIKYLCENGAEINRQSKYGTTVLQLALLRKAEINVVKYLVENGAEINSESKDGFKALHCALRSGAKSDVIKFLVENGAELNLESEDSLTALHCALRNSIEFDILKYLVGSGAEINRESKDGSRALHCALQGGAKLEVIKYLVKKGAEINRKSKDGFKALHYALSIGAESNDVKYSLKFGAEIYLEMGNTLIPRLRGGHSQLDVVKFLVENGAEINHKLEDGWTPLHCAVKSNAKLNIVKYLVQSGAGINCESKHGLTALHYAVGSEAPLNVVRYLVENGAQINHESEDRLTPLHCAVKNNAKLNIVKYLVQRGAGINCESKDGSTPLHYAVGSVNVVKYLIKNRAEINHKSKDGSTPLHYAVGSRNEVKYLIGNGGEINHKSEDGWTPLHCIVDGRTNLEVIRYLVKNGADINSEAELTPLHAAVRSYAKLDVLKYLVENGADVKRKSKDGFTTMHWALLRCRQLDVIKYLVDNGAEITSKGSSKLNLRDYGNIDPEVEKYLLEKVVEFDCDSEDRSRVEI